MDDDLRHEVDRIKHWFLGNGDAGVFQRLSTIEASQERFAAQLALMEMAAEKAHNAANRAFDAAQDIKYDRQREKAWRRGAIWAMGAIFALFGFAGSIAASRILSVLNDLAARAP